MIPSVKDVFPNGTDDLAESDDTRENPDKVLFDVASCSPLYFAGQHDISHKDTSVPGGG
jgi:hypothetical protein